MEDEPLLWDSDLENFLEEALRRSPDSSGRTHVLIGDSVARDAPIGVAPPDLLFHVVKGGHSWRRLVAEVGDNIGSWRHVSSSYERSLGRAVVWMSGNDIYTRRGTRVSGLELDRLGEDATRVVEALGAATEGVVVLGPLPRFKFDEGKTWTQTPAYLAERCLRHSMEHINGVTVENLGRSLTITRGKCKALVPAVQSYYKEDQVHLASRGYEKVVGKMPGWLTRVTEAGDAELVCF